jgi:hypothetical protein
MHLSKVHKFTVLKDSQVMEMRPTDADVGEYKELFKVNDRVQEIRIIVVPRSSQDGVKCP